MLPYRPLILELKRVLGEVQVLYVFEPAGEQAIEGRLADGYGVAVVHLEINQCLKANNAIDD